MALRACVHAIALLGFVGLVACEPLPTGPSIPAVPPQARPEAAALVAPAPTATAPASEQSRALSRYYTRMQADLLARGLLRVDGGGPDTPFTDTMLARNFARIALEEEYVRGGGLQPSTAGARSSAIKKWTQPVRVAVEHGPGVPQNQRAWNRAEVAKFTQRLARVTGHPMVMSDDTPNFHVLFMSEDDSALIAPRILDLVPDANPAALRMFNNLPRGIHCVMVAFAKEAGGYDYGTAIAVIRSEHPDLMRRSCIHEEMAQGMGLGNDSPRARPSIFNDDDEFALLTTHDELLLQLLYDPRLRPGMRADVAMPIVEQRATELVGGAGPM